MLQMRTDTIVWWDSWQTPYTH